MTEYSPQLHYVRGPENVLADAFSCIPCAESKVGKDMPTNDDNVIDKHYLECFHSMLDEPELFECFLNIPEMNAPAENPLNMEWIREQQNDPELLASVMKYPERYVNKVVDGTDILCHIKPGDDPETQWKIALAQGMVLPTINWFHQILGHPGTKTMHLTLNKVLPL